MTNSKSSILATVEENPAAEGSVDTEFELKFSEYADKMEICSTCHVRCPHSQLFVCTNNACDFSVQKKVSILTPALFYRTERVFCGACAFRGIHSKHSSFMQEAEPMAFKVASAEAGLKLEMDCQEFFELHENRPADYLILQERGGTQFEKIPFVKYLSNSSSIVDWHQRLSILQDSVRIINESRQAGQNAVKEKAVELLATYRKKYYMIEEKMNTMASQKKDLEKARIKDHQSRMGPKTSICSHISVRKHRSSHSTNTTMTTALLKNKKKTVKSEESNSEMEDEYMKKPLMEENKKVLRTNLEALMKEEPLEKKELESVEENVEQTEESEKEPEQKTVAQIQEMICRRYERMVVSVGTAGALKFMGDILEKEFLYAHDKNEIAAYMEKTYSIQWPMRYD